MTGYLLDTHAAIWFFNGDETLSETNHITILPIKTSHLTVLESLPMIHRDPFDRILVATALDEGMTLITADRNIARYDVPQIW